MATELKTVEDIKHAYYINLEHRTDRKAHVESQLTALGIEATRFNAIKMDNGAIGCSMSHLKLLQNALDNQFEHILIVEDDITFLNPELFKTQFRRFLELHKNNWDVILFAGNNMPPYDTPDDTCVKVTQCQTTTGYLVNGHFLKVLVKNVKMGLTHLVSKPNEHVKFAIDRFWFVLQSASRWFLITPLTVIQRSDYSDIEKKVINYEKIMTDLDKDELLKKMRERSHPFAIQKSVASNHI